MGEPIGSSPGFRRPVVVQCGALNRSRSSTVVCMPLTSKWKWANAPGNLLLRAELTGLPKDSVADASLLVAFGKRQQTERIGRLPRQQVQAVLIGIDVVLGR